MTDQVKAETTDPIIVDEAHMERFTNDQLAYQAWISTDSAQDVLFDDEACEDSLHDAKFDVAFACTALRVLLRRLTGMDPDALREAVMQVHLEKIVLRPEIDQLPAPETLQ